MLQAQRTGTTPPDLLERVKAASGNVTIPAILEEKPDDFKDIVTVSPDADPKIVARWVLFMQRNLNSLHFDEEKNRREEALKTVIDDPVFLDRVLQEGTSLYFQDLEDDCNNFNAEYVIVVRKTVEKLLASLESFEYDESRKLAEVVAMALVCDLEKSNERRFPFLDPENNNPGTKKYIAIVQIIKDRQDASILYINNYTNKVIKPVVALLSDYLSIPGNNKLQAFLTRRISSIN